MNEKIGKLLQNFQSIKGKFTLITGKEETVYNLLSFMDLDDLEGDPEFRELISEISARQKGNYGVTDGRPLCMNMVLY